MGDNLMENIASYPDFSGEFLPAAFIKPICGKQARFCDSTRGPSTSIYWKQLYDPL